MQQLSDISCEPLAILIEPEAKNTAAAVNNKPELILEIDKIRVKGKKDPEVIFGLLESEASSEEINSVDSYLEGFRTGNLEKSLNSLETILAHKESAVYSYASLMKNRIEELSKTKLPENWDGVYTAETK